MEGITDPREATHPSESDTASWRSLCCTRCHRLCKTCECKRQSAPWRPGASSKTVHHRSIRPCHLSLVVSDNSAGPPLTSLVRNQPQWAPGLPESPQLSHTYSTQASFQPPETAQQELRVLQQVLPPRPAESPLSSCGLKAFPPDHVRRE